MAVKKGAVVLIFSYLSEIEVQKLSQEADLTGKLHSTRKMKLPANRETF